MGDDKPEGDEPHYLGHRQRLRERFMRGGGEALSDYEMLELGLFSAIPRRDVKPLAKTLIKRFESFAGVISADPTKLAEVSGMGESAVASLKIIREAAVRLSRQEILNRPVLSSWDKVIAYCRAE